MNIVTKQDLIEMLKPYDDHTKIVIHIDAFNALTERDSKGKFTGAIKDCDTQYINCVKPSTINTLALECIPA